jgi:glycosyltransferase involved in cell wall biosynthesis
MMNGSDTSSIVGAPGDFALVRTQRAKQFASMIGRRQGDVRRVLLISYAFPPTGGGGVQRATKFAKYLPANGWRPTVLTVANPSVPVQDHDLEHDLDPSLSVVRARTWEPGYGVKTKLTDAGHRGQAFRRLIRQIGMQVLQPDPQILWNPTAYRDAVHALSRQSHDAILVTAPPFSSFLLGCRLKKRFRIPLVLDFRDEWMLVGKYLENHQMSRLACRIQRGMMRRALRAADAVVATTEASATELADCCRQAGSAASVSCIYNGYDPDDFEHFQKPRRPGPVLAMPRQDRSWPTDREPTISGKLRIVYTGTLWKLTDISPLVFALESLEKKSTVLASSVELIVAGRLTPPQDAVLERLMGTGVSVIRHDYLPHGQSLQLAATADQLLLLLADEPGAERVVPAKLFEYMALGKSILAISPDGETCDLMREHAKVNRFHPTEIEKIAHWLESEVTESSHPGSVQQVTSRQLAGTDSLDQFSRQSLTRQLADVLQCCVQR